jgi:hypothetical protein
MNRAIKWWSSQFPESLYPCIPEKNKEYVERVLHGHEIASNSNVVIAGLCRDNQNILPYTLSRLECLADLFFDAVFCIFENDSVDLTTNILAEWSNNTKYENYVSCKKFGFKKHGSVKTEERIKNMSSVRRNLQDMVRTVSEDLSIDYVILIDMDIEGFSYEGILNTLSYQFDCMGSNGLIYKEEKGQRNRLYFDSYGSKFIPEKTDEQKNLTLLHRGEPPILMESAFGGLAVYRLKPYISGQYSVGDWNNYCEHIPFHSSMKTYLNPSQITIYNRTRYSL